MKILGIPGSLRRASINRALLVSARALAPAGVELVIDDLRPIPMYDPDLDDPAALAPVEAFKQRIAEADALLIATPEYNYGIPGVLKNAIDWASRPYGDSAFTGKPVGIVGASVGAPGTSMAQQHLRNILAYLDAPTLGQPEVFIQFTPERFADDGTVTDPSTREFLGDWLTAFREWIGHFATAG